MLIGIIPKELAIMIVMLTVCTFFLVTCRCLYYKMPLLLLFRDAV